MINSAHPQYPNDSSMQAAGMQGRLSATHGGVPARRRSSGSRPDDLPVDWRGLVRSFNRRWFLCLSAGMILGIAGAVAAWILIPAPYVATAEFYIKSYEDVLMFNTKEQHANFHTRKQSSQRLLRGREVITAALRDSEVSTALDRLAPNAIDPVNWLSEQLQINNQGGEFFAVSLSGEDRQALPVVVNAVAKSFMKKEVYGAQEERLKNVDLLEDGLALNQRKLAEKHEALKAMFEQSQAANPEMSQQRHQFLLEMHVALRGQLEKVELELVKAQAQQNYLAGKGESEVPISDTVVDAHAMQYPEYQQLMQQVERFQTFAARCEENFAEGHPRIAESQAQLAEAQAELDALREKLRPEVRERLRQSQLMAGEMSDAQLTEHIAQLETLKAECLGELEGLKVEEKKSGIMTIELQKIDRDIAQLESMCATLESEISRRRFELHTPRLPIEIYQTAEVPHFPDLKKRLFGTAAGGFGLFGLVIGGIVFFDWRSRRISSVNEVSGELPVRLIGTIPAMPRSALVDQATSSRQNQKNLFWQSAFKESIDAARTMLVSESERVGHRAIMVGSACSSEGKTTLACHLATSLARAGRRVVLVDCDLRRPSVHRVFGVEDGPGVCELMRSELELEETIQEGSISGLDVLAAGQVDSTALEHLASNALAPLFARLRDEYDFVIVDSSPVLPVCDALLVAQLMDGVMVSVRRDVSRMDNVSAAINRFASIGIPILGAVTIGLDDDPVSYGGYFRSRARLRYGHDYLVGAT